MADKTKKAETEENLDSQAPGWTSKLLGWTSFSFVDLAGEALDLWTEWKATRNWLKIFAAFPIFLAVIVFSCFVAFGKLTENRTKVMWYVEKAERQIKLTSEEAKLLAKQKDENEVPTSEPEKSSLEKPKNAIQLAQEKEKNKEETEIKKELELFSGLTVEERELREKSRADLVDLLFRRVLQLEKSNRQALYYVALQMSRYGKMSAARQIMETLAPLKFSGFDLAHAWIAADMIQRGQRGQPINTETLKHHLKHGTVREEVNPALLVVYSQLLQRDEQFSQAEQIVKRASRYEPSVLLSSIETYNRNGMAGQAKAAADQLSDSLKNKLSGPKGDDNLILIAQAYLMTNRLDNSIDLLRVGLSKNPQSTKLKRALSDAFRIKFRSTATKVGDQVKVNLELLNFAIVVDPTNIAVQGELTLLAGLGVGQGESSLNALRSQIAVGGTSFSSRLMIAEASYRQKDYETATKQYEVVLAELPNMTLALNNLAMIYTFLDPPRLDDAVAMIAKAIEVSPTVAEFRDSQGDILIACNRKADAVASYEEAIKLVPEREDTRKKLIKLLEELDLPERADEERETLVKVQKALEERRIKMQEAQAAQAAQANLNSGVKPSPEKQDQASPSGAPAVQPGPNSELTPPESAEQSAKPKLPNE